MDARGKPAHDKCAGDDHFVYVSFTRLWRYH